MTHEDLQLVTRSAQVKGMELKIAALMCWTAPGFSWWNFATLACTWNWWCACQLLWPSSYPPHLTRYSRQLYLIWLSRILLTLYPSLWRELPRTLALPNDS
jgi:hypothetical protein